MSSWVNLPDLLSLRAEFDQLAPDRDRGGDGTIGDQAHADRSSDHNPDETGATPHEDSDNINEVHALDVDSTGPWPFPMTMADAVDVVIDTCKRLGSKSPLNYVIWDKHIYQHPSWTRTAYTGTDPHTGHAHFSSRYGSGSGSSNPENYSGPWGLLEVFGVLSADDKKWITDQIAANNATLVKAIFKTDGIIPGPTNAPSVMDGTNLTWTLGGYQQDQSYQIRALGSTLGDQLRAVAARLDALTPPPPTT